VIGGWWLVAGGWRFGRGRWSWREPTWQLRARSLVRRGVAPNTRFSGVWSCRASSSLRWPWVIRRYRAALLRRAEVLSGESTRSVARPVVRLLAIPPDALVGPLCVVGPRTPSSTRRALSLVALEFSPAATTAFPSLTQPHRRARQPQRVSVIEPRRGAERGRYWDPTLFGTDHSLVCALKQPRILRQRTKS